MRIYKPKAVLGMEISLTKEEQRHIKVLRLKPGEKIYVFDGQGNEYAAEHKGKVSETLKLVEKVDKTRQPRHKITLAIAPAKGYRMDFLVEKATELGVSTIIPTICERSIVRPGDSKIDRWRKIAIEACCQSGRATIPEITKPQTFQMILEKVSEYDKAYICDIKGNEGKGAANTIVFIGPEGGFSPEEIEKALETGIMPLKLSENILRVETAGITAVSELAQ